MALSNKLKTLLEAANTLDDFKDCSSYFYKWLRNEFSKQPVKHLIRSRAAFVDLLLQKLYKITGLSEHQDIALIAVGGYGRGELHPYSDIDFLLLVKSEPSETLKESLGQFVTHLWDLGLEIGHSVRTHEQVLEQKNR